MKKSTRKLYDQLEEIAERNIFNQLVIADEIQNLVVDADNESIQIILDDVVTRLSGPGWGSMKSAVAAIKFALEGVLKKRASGN